MMSTPRLAIRMPRHPLNAHYISPYHHPRNGDTEESPYRFVVPREEVQWRWHLLWLLFFGVTVSILTLLFLLTGTAYPIPGWWTRYSSHSLNILKIAENIYHPQAATNYSTTHALPPVSYAESGHIFARRGNRDVIAPRTTLSRPSINGPVYLVDNNLSLLVQVRIPDIPRASDARCTITSGMITLTRHLESAGKAARVQLWSLADTTSSDVSTLGENHPWLSPPPPRREAHLSSFDVLPGEMPAQRSAEFACPPSRSLHTFEVSCADGDDVCSVEVWQGLFRVEVRT